MTKEIQLTQGFVTLVDDDMFDYLSQWKWCVLVKKWGAYAVRQSSSYKGLRKFLFMHRIILGAKEAEQGDHWDGNTLNNQKANLRICTASGNACNRVVSNRNTSGYKGVSWYKRHKKWCVRITIKGRRFHLGYFDDLVQAALAYDDGARKYHGQFARTNFLEV